MPLFLWPVVRYTSGMGHGSLAGVLNGCIHIVMYSYYFLSALGPWIRPYLWWKRYLTVAQMTQFAVILVHQAQLLIREEECGYPKENAYAFIALMAFFLVTFGDFFKGAYAGKEGTKVVKDD